MNDTTVQALEMLNSSAGKLLAQTDPASYLDACATALSQEDSKVFKGIRELYSKAAKAMRTGSTTSGCGCAWVDGVLTRVHPQSKTSGRKPEQVSKTWAEWIQNAKLVEERHNPIEDYVIRVYKMHNPIDDCVIYIHSIVRGESQ